MHQRSIGFFLCLLMLFSTSEVFAGKGGGGGRSSYSGGSRSYSSGSSFKPSSSSSSFKPSSSSSSSGFKPSPAKPGGSYSSGSGKGYSSGAGKSTVAPPANAVPGAKSYQSGNKVYTPVNSGGSYKPKGGAFDKSASEAQKRAESKAAYTRGSESRSTYTTPTGKSVKIDSTSKSVTQIRTITHEQYVTREVRIVNFYQPYYSRPVVIYNDPYNSFFWWWMLDRSLEERAYWAYHHRATMDQARYNELLKRDARLEARIRQLEAEKIARDPSYIPKGIDRDLCYTDDYVDAAVNPHHVATVPEDSGANAVLGWLCFAVVIGGLVWLGIYLLFIKNW